MTQNVFIVLMLLLSCFSCNAQSQPDTLQTYSTEAAACFGYQKSMARMKDATGQSRAIVIDNAGRVFMIVQTCKRGYYREPVPPATVAGTD